MPHEEHFARAALRHHRDAKYLHADGRLPNADHLYGFAVECALKSMLLRYLGASMGPKSNGRPATKPWTPHDQKEYGHLPKIWTDVSILAHGRTASKIAAVLSSSMPFRGWDVADRYTDGASISAATVASRQAAAEAVLNLHDQAIISGVLP